jgi:hypothetical protein
MRVALCSMGLQYFILKQAILTLQSGSFILKVALGAIKTDTFSNESSTLFDGITVFYFESSYLNTVE